MVVLKMSQKKKDIFDRIKFNIFLTLFKKYNTLKTEKALFDINKLDLFARIAKYRKYYFLDQFFLRNVNQS